MQCESPSSAQQGKHAYTNALINESSPYLLQHAHNPVDWRPWGDEALKKARDENKMLLISIGYAACHWCHVMEHESFEDSIVADMMNRHFVPIKVDREERPDVDDVYMTACHLASGRSCGWPLNSFALPDGRPVWAGTYFPKKDWLNVLNYFVKLQADEPEKLEQFASQLVQGIRQNEKIDLMLGDAEFTEATIDQIAKRFIDNIDKKLGGRTGAPKFPMPNNYEFLMRYAFVKNDVKAKKAVMTTLDKMAQGGIFDQVGGGFARYSVDARWHVPHFEKMMYDNAQLVSLYSDAYKWTGNPLYKRTVEETTEWVAREMTDETGGFYSSLDADSEGEEGKFYVWTEEEIDAIIADEKSRNIIKDYYDIKSGGNWEHNKNVLQILKSDADVAKRNNIDESELAGIIQNAKKQLFEKRKERIRPGLDDKILTSWNALMLKGYVDAYRAFGDDRYLHAASKNADFLRENMFREDGGLNRNYKDGKSVINAFLDDYATVIDAWTAMYEVTFDESWLNEAKKLTDYTITHFLDDSTKMFFYTSNLDPPLIARKKEVSDNVIPASNSMMAKALHKLGLYFYNQEYLALAKQMLQNMLPSVTTASQPSFFSNWCDLYADHVWPLYEVAILGDQADTKSAELMQQYLPQSIFMGGKSEGSLQLLKDKLAKDETYIYVCQNKVCKFPVTDVEKAIDLMHLD